MSSIKISPYKKRKPAIELTGPGDWDDLTPVEFLMVLRARLNVEDIFHQALVLVKILFKVPDWYMAKLNHVQGIQLASLMNFAFDPEIKIERWLIKKVFPDGINPLFGPGDTLDNISFGELMYADLNFRKYQETKSNKYLNKLIAVLFRKKSTDEEFKKTGDLRTTFNKVHLDADAEYCSSIKEEVKQAILINYIGCRSIMASLFSNVFPVINREAGNENLEKNQKNIGWLDVAIQLARKEHALGTISEVENQNAYLVLKVLDKVILENEELENEINKIR